MHEPGDIYGSTLTAPPIRDPGGEPLTSLIYDPSALLHPHVFGLASRRTEEVGYSNRFTAGAVNLFDFSEI